MRVGRKIDQFRYQRGWTQEMLAARLQLAGWMISRSKISRIESGLAHVYDTQLFFFAEVLTSKSQPFSKKQRASQGATFRRCCSFSASESASK